MRLSRGLALLTDSKAIQTFLKELLMFSGKTPKKSHSFSLTAGQHWREINCVTGSELPLEVDAEPHANAPARPSGTGLRKEFSDPRGRMPGAQIPGQKGLVGAVRDNDPASRTDEVFVFLPASVALCAALCRRSAEPGMIP
ncbi:hypothetical protein [Mesorhizobium amorphae]|uniref:hypothetical protein n=1 Tax=Mesorhizobium amorphae TaxID=71433 RepID=UPI0017868DF7|nr:hypothetical protein [Mesorhizobium amorphae]